MSDDHFDVIVVGAGLSGIDAGYHLQQSLPGKSYAILESRDAMGGTWDLFRYPGIRSDSDMYTLGFPFKPWTGDRSIADGASIRDYIVDTAREHGIDHHIRYGHKVMRADWSSADATWTLTVQRDGAPVTLTCRFLYLCAGYYDYEHGYMPEFAGIESFEGLVIHPQFWPEDLECQGRKIVIVGSGATAVTLVPALAERGAKVVMLQRSPSYVVARPAKDKLAARLQRMLPESWAYGLIRWRNVLVSLYFYNYSRKNPAKVKQRILAMAKKDLGPSYDIRTHFTPRYNPWDQRMCLVPDADLFRVLKRKAAEVVTDEIETFTPKGLRLKSGRELPADIVVSATGLKLKLVGGITLTVDGQRVDLSKATSYKGSMFSGVPNLAYAIGYTNASWTLKCDLTSSWMCRVIAHMDQGAYASCVPVLDASVGQQPLISFSSGYVKRSIDAFPKQGDRKPWRLNQNYVLDTMALKLGKVDDGTLQFRKAREMAEAA